MDIIPVEDDDTPDYPSPVAVGDTVTVSGTLTTRNSVGGTETLEHAGTECTVTKAFWDYEAGWRYHGRVADTAATEEFRRQATCEFTPESYRELYPNQPHLYERAKSALEKFDPGYVFFSEHDLARDHAPAPGATRPGP